MPFLIRKNSLFGKDEAPIYDQALSKQIIVVGLGNPGSKYSQTRHNLGFIAIDQIAKHYNQSLAYKSKFKAEIGEIVEDGCKIYLVKPQTFMNNSGEALSLIINWLKIPLKDLYVIVDQVQLNWGLISVKTTKSRSPHNGIHSIQQHLNNDNINLFQIGVGPRQPEIDLSSFVLSKLPKTQIEQIPQIGQAVIELTQEASVATVSLGKRYLF